MYIYIYMQRNLNQQIPESTGTQDINRGKARSPCPENRKHGCISPFSPGSQQQREGIVTASCENNRGLM